MMMQTANVETWKSETVEMWKSESSEFRRLTEVVALIGQHLGIKCSLGSQMKDLTSIGVGGPIVAVVFPKNARAALQLVQHLTEEGIAWSPLGFGTNIVATDHYHHRVAVSLREFYGTPRIDDSVVQVSAGLSLPALIHVTAECGLSGLEGLSGLSGSVGGALKRNARAYGHEIGAVTRSVTVLSRDGIRTLSQEGIGFAWGRSRISDDELILTATFQLARGDRAQITRTIARYRKAYLEHRPGLKQSVGGVFENPSGQCAGRIIDELGLKGLARGGAVVSEAHANYIINRGKATAADVLELMEAVRRTVLSRRQIELRDRVQIWREENV